MGHNISSPIKDNLDSLHTQLMKHAGADYDIATATTLTYDQFLSYIKDLNKICVSYKDENGCVLVFAVKKGSDTSLFWKATVRVACVKLNTTTNEVETHRLLNIRQFLQVFRRISYECTDGALGIPSPRNEEGATAPNPDGPLPPTVAASMILNESGSRATSPSVEDLKDTCQAIGGGKKCDGDDLKKDMHCTNLEECVICLERKPDVILPCCHAYCLPCIEQWWEYCDNAFEDECLARNIYEQMNVVDKSCPVCRESLSSTGDTWVLPEIPDKSEVCKEIKRSLISFASCSGTSSERNPSGTKNNLPDPP